MTTTIPAGLIDHRPDHVHMYLALMAFAEEGNDSPTYHDLTVKANLTSPSTVQRRLVGMEQAGMIARHPHDNRVRYELLL